jgi:hypothetical protein
MTRRETTVRIVALVAGVLLWSAAVVADDHIVEFDRQVNFSIIKTFALHTEKVDVPTPELNNALVLKKISSGIRDELTAKGLKETADRPDVLVNYSLTGTAYTIGSGGRAWPIGPDGRGAGRAGGPGVGVDPVGFIEGTLVIDLETRAPGALVWRGVYRESEKTGAKLNDKLAGEVKTLFSEYPPKKKP